MSFPDFDRAQYVQPEIMSPAEVPGYAGDVYPAQAAASGVFARALLFGTAAAVLGSLGYALIGLSGWMVSIVVIGIAWLIARAMLVGSGGAGGRAYQVAACGLTHLAATTGRLFDILHSIDAEAHLGLGTLLSLNRGLAAELVLLGPLLRLRTDPVNGAIGLLILFFGLRTAWTMMSGRFAPGSGPRVGPFGMR